MLKLCVKNEDEEILRKNWHPLYRLLEPCADLVKIALQMLVGVLILVFLVWKLLIDAQIVEYCGNMAEILAKHELLEIVAYGLGVSAGIELAYMLFTPGPDEAIDPLIMGLASSLLLLISAAESLTWQSGLGVLFITIAMGILLYFRNKLDQN